MLNFLIYRILFRLLAIYYKEKAIRSVVVNLSLIKRNSD